MMWKLINFGVKELSPSSRKQLPCLKERQHIASNLNTHTKRIERTHAISRHFTVATKGDIIAFTLVKRDILLSFFSMLQI